MMKKHLLITLFAVPGLMASAQTFLPEGETNAVSEMSVGIPDMMSDGEDDPSDEMSSLILSEGSAFGDEESALAEQEPDSAARSRASFLIATGSAYLEDGEEEDAERAYRRALEMDSDNDEAIVRLAVLYVNMERYADAIELYKRQLEKDPENALSNNNLAWCYIVGPEVRNIPLALRHAREAILTAPRLSSAWNTLAEAYYVSGDYEKALQSSEFALGLLVRSEQIPPGEQEKYIEQLEKIKRTQQAAEMLGQ